MRARSSRGTHSVVILALAFAVVLGGVGPSAAQTARALPDFDVLWDEAKRWAVETGTVPEDCVFDFRFDPKTNAPRDGRAVTCDEPYRSPFYPYPEPSRPGVRFTADDIRSYARDFEAGSGRPRRPGGTSDEALFETCGLVVGFSATGHGARRSSAIGARAVCSASGRTRDTSWRRKVADASPRGCTIASSTSRTARCARSRSVLGGRTHRQPSELQIEGKVIGRDGHRLMIRGKARPVYGGSSAEPGVVTSESDLVVEYPSDDALRPGYYFAGEHYFKDKREKVNSAGLAVTEWTYGPCALSREQYWMFEQYPPGRKTLVHGPYAEYGQCERDRRRTKTGKAIASVGGHCERKAKVAFRMTNDGTLMVPKDAPPLD